MGRAVHDLTPTLPPSYAEPAVKNQRGEQGPICAYCGGYGFTNSIVGTNVSPGCLRCHGTGIEPPDLYAMAQRLDALESTLRRLVTVLESRS